MDRLSQWLVRLGALGLVAMTAIIGWQVFGRFVLGSSPSWTEQAALILMIWYVFLAAASGIWERFHIRIEVLEQSLTPSSRHKLRLGLHLVVALFGLVLLIYGSQLVLAVREHVVPSLGISRSFAYLPIPFVGVMTIIFSIVHFTRRLRSGQDTQEQS
jgi:TRAP-type C4-dicarboxylate transport system permease small subunit